MNLNEWAIQWGVPYAALEDLRRRVGAMLDERLPAADAGASEAAIQARIRLEASRKGMRLWRNNVGAGYSEDGSFMRWGLANDSASVNKVIKSGDLIGLRPVTIGPQHVGHVIGQFVSREVKAGSWVYRGTPREVAQLNWANLINSLGGDASFANKDDTL